MKKNAIVIVIILAGLLVGLKYFASREQAAVDGLAPDEDVQDRVQHEVPQPQQSTVSSESTAQV